MSACLIAVGLKPSQIEEFLNQDTRKLLMDHSCGYLSLLPNILQKYGWNPGKRLLHWFGETLENVTGNADITFWEVYEGFGIELCIVATNLNLMSVEYFHPKTSPNMPIRKAVRMSMSIPGIFQSVLHKNHEHFDVYVDGGLLCNYPIHAFDGWWLSMKPEDSFLRKLQPLNDLPRLFDKSERFGVWNDKTIGLMLYSRTENEFLKTYLSARDGCQPPLPPRTKLSIAREKIRQKQQIMMRDHSKVVKAIERFLKVLAESNIDEDAIIDKTELKLAFSDKEKFSDDDAYLLFGKDYTLASAFETLDTDGDGSITFQELVNFVEKRGVSLQARFEGLNRKEINGLGDFMVNLQEALSINVKKVYVEKRDVERTIGIDTDYIETTDFELLKEDREFLLEVGRRSARAFLYDFLKRKNPPRKTAADYKRSRRMEALRHQQLLRRRSEQILGLSSGSQSKNKKSLSGRKKVSIKKNAKNPMMRQITEETEITDSDASDISSTGGKDTRRLNPINNRPRTRTWDN
ncbi:uncharacterized protein TRIADDRAFT_55065 [Trichoplax adhaerens]|uniref:EF-hand domain-containing protein n=1 Tax=Trichoplax adhaerens TaxID=10228 RepID=B3RQP5_TRIAD|nr:hypothetical protein TRIADDRAFT_55065 [Trichoplax adhaerens]EDV26731.1 hypothetical protein TRIADDRAFT_55065 [Trichoplax adhaerens]|eukprot:XP_002110727.1 hypothetical protein TRIADDRAFT_55065 [Trichoplax adhaerens]